MDLLALDRALDRDLVELRWAPLTPVMKAASWEWLKLLVFPAAALAVTRRLRVPVLALVAYVVASALANGLKFLFDRPRPSLGNHVRALVAVPGNPSFPSGHAATAFAAATVLALLVPRLRVAALAVAALVAYSRVYLGVHFPLDVVAGGVLGAAIGWSVVRIGERARPTGYQFGVPWRARPSSSSSSSRSPPSS